MEENLQFIIKIMDAAWFVEIVIWALSWVILCHGWSWRLRHPGQWTAELLLLAVAITAGQVAILLFAGSTFYLLL